METESDGAQLHDRATRGATLSAAERQRLDTWYAEQDAAEAASLRQPLPTPFATLLHEQIAAATAQLSEAAQRVQELAAENAALRDEIAALQHQLAQQAASRIA